MKLPGWRTMGWKVGKVEDVEIGLCKVEAVDFDS